MFKFVRVVTEFDTGTEIDHIYVNMNLWGNTDKMAEFPPDIG